MKSYYHSLSHPPIQTSTHSYGVGARYDGTYPGSYAIGSCVGRDNEGSPVYNSEHRRQVVLVEKWFIRCKTTLIHLHLIRAQAMFVFLFPASSNSLQKSPFDPLMIRRNFTRVHFITFIPTPLPGSFVSLPRNRCTRTKVATPKAGSFGTLRRSARRIGTTFWACGRAGFQKYWMPVAEPTFAD